MEDESMEGKDFALNEVVKEAFKKRQEADQKGEENYVNPVLMIGESMFEMDVNKDEKEGTYKMHILGIHILTLDENNELKFEEGWEENLTNRIKECNGLISEKDGEDLIENLKQMDKQIEQEKDEKEKDEEDLSDDMEEEQEEEEEEEQEEDKEKKDKEDDKEVEGKNKPQNLKKLNANIIKMLAPSTRPYGNIYLNSEGEIVGYNKSTKQIEPVNGISKIKGSSANKQIHGTEKDKHQHVNASILYQIDSRPNTGFAVTIDGTENGNRDLKYTMRKEGSNRIDDFAYADIPLLASQKREGIGRAKEESGIREGIRGQGERDQVLDEKDELDEGIEIPEDMAKKFDDKMNSVPIKTMKEFKDELMKLVKEKLDKERPNDFPNSHTKHAETIVDAMVDENENYEKAKDDLYEGKNKDEEERGDDDGEKLPGDNLFGRR